MSPDPQLGTCDGGSDGWMRHERNPACIGWRPVGVPEPEAPPTIHPPSYLAGWNDAKAGRQYGEGRAPSEPPERLRAKVSEALRAAPFPFDRDATWTQCSAGIDAATDLVMDALAVPLPDDEGELWFTCTACGVAWTEDDLQQIQPDGHYACPSSEHEEDGSDPPFSVLRRIPAPSEPEGPPNG